MDLSPTAYNDWAKIIRKYSEHLIENIANQKECYTTVLGIGSGLGNISTLLFEKLKIENLFGIDVDQRMIDLANSQKPSSKVMYLVQDIALNWNDLRPELKALEGRVDLIFSSFALHFIQDRRNTAENISKLLAPGGQLQAVVFCLTDSLGTQTIGNEIPMKIPSANEQVNLWTTALNQAGLKVEQAKLFKFEESVPYDVAKIYYQAVSVCYRQFLNKELDENSQNDLVNRSKEKLMENSYKFIGDMNGTQIVTCESDIYTLKVIKHN